MKRIIFSLVLLIVIHSGQARDFALEPMTVSDTKTTEPTFNREPDSKTEFNAVELTERGMNRVQEISKQVANFDYTNQSLGSFRQIFSMRGLTNTSIYGAPATVFYIDDMAYSSAMTNMGALFDIDNISVYRTAQPAGFGKNAYAGAVNIETKQATNEFKARLSFERANFDYYNVGFKTSGALLTDELFFNLAGVYTQRDGYLYNSYYNNRPDDSESFSGRAALTWKPSNNLNIRLTAAKEDFDYGSPRFVLLNSIPSKSFTIAAGLKQSLKQNTDSQSLRVEYNTDNYKLLSISSRRFWQNTPMVVDLDLRPRDIASRYLSNQNETWTQEFRLSPKTKSFLDWNIGAFYSAEQYHELDANKNEVFDANKRTDNYAVFGHLGYKGIKNLNLYSDLRFDYVTSHLNSTMNANYFPQGVFIPASLTYDTYFFSPKLGVDYQFDNNSVMYLSTGFGFKPGGLTYITTAPRTIQFKQEIAWQNNIGIKTTWLDDRIKTNLSGFYYHVHNYQVERFFSGGNYSVFNAPRVSSTGLEFEAQAELIPYLTLDTNIGYTHARFDSYHDAISQIDYSGNRVPFVPLFNSLAALQYKHPNGYFARTEWLWKGKTYFDETVTLNQLSYSLVNVRLGYEKPHYSIYAYTNNLSNIYYYTTQLGVRGSVGDPRTFGVQLSLSY